jgi:hypothetical protein
MLKYQVTEMSVFEFSGNGLFKLEFTETLGVGGGVGAGFDYCEFLGVEVEVMEGQLFQWGCVVGFMGVWRALELTD